MTGRDLPAAAELGTSAGLPSAPSSPAAASLGPSPPDPAATRASTPDLSAHPAVRRVLDALALQHVTPEVVTLPEAVRTAVAAAAALAVTPAEIANSLLFRAHAPDSTVTPLLILASGAHRVDLVKVADLVDDVDHIDRADAAFVLATTGFPIGGVAPVGHLHPVRTLVDVSLSRYRYVWAAAAPCSAPPTRSCCASRAGTPSRSPERGHLACLRRLAVCRPRGTRGYLAGPLLALPRTAQSPLGTMSA